MRAIVAILFVAALSMGACEHTIRTAGVLPHDVYVWQRAWTPQLRAGIEQARGTVRSLVVLVAEISVTDETPRIVRPAVDFDALRTSNAPIGLAARIGSFGEGFPAGRHEGSIGFDGNHTRLPVFIAR